MLTYDSRSLQCKSPYGAVPAGTAITFRAQCSQPLTLVIHRDYEPWDRYDFRDGVCTLRIDTPQVYWYYFETPDCRYYRDPLTNQPVEEQDGCTWQLTVYDPAYRTPAWLPGGVMYQIFPDRFACSGTDKSGVPEDRVMHSSQDELPDPPEPPGRLPCSDYFGGDLEGIRLQLDRLTRLSVNTLYLNPIFEAHSNHRYNTADYSRLDPMLGDEQDFIDLLETARTAGIRVLLDGVFSHVGDDSIYMDRHGRYSRHGRYGNSGAWQCPDSPYRDWFTFREDGSYQCWWNIPTLPEVNENHPAFRAEIGRAVQKWQSMGTGGWRLDVADELPDPFLEWLRRQVKAVDPEAYLLGEVWEDATTKQHEGIRREYLLGKQLDAVMNYPWRTAVLDWVLNGNGTLFRARIETICENYPRPALRCLMNHLGTHDTPRLLSVLGGDDLEALNREQARAYVMTETQRQTALSRMPLAVTLQYALPGVPCVYYGDEQCMEGAGDPYCRGFYTQRGHQAAVYETYRTLGQLRSRYDCFRDGGCRILRADDSCILLERSGTETLRFTVTRTRTLLPAEGEILYALRADRQGLEDFGVRVERIM